MEQDFAAALEKFVAGAQAIVDKGMERYPTNPGKLLTVMMGPRYVRIVVQDVDRVTREPIMVERPNGEKYELGRSCYCFIDRSNGNVLKSAGWKAPAKGARGNIFKDAPASDAVSEYGAHYRR